MSRPVLLFDGHCNLCNGAVNRVLDLEAGPTLGFAALQSDAGRSRVSDVVGEAKAKALCEGVAGAPGSMVLVEEGRLYTESTAALRVAAHLRAPYRWLRLLLVVPRPLRDLVYRWVARHRYRWFGRTETCRVPTPELRGRFLTDG